MADVDTARVQITPEDLAAARAFYKGKLADCPFCGGFGKPDPRRSPAYGAPTLTCVDESTLWAIHCYSCGAQVTSDQDAADVVARWNRRAGGVHAQQQLLALVDLQSIARRAGVDLAPALEVFARHVQADVLSLNRRPTC